MSLSEAYGGKPDHTILALIQFRKDLESMGPNDKIVYGSTVRLDDDLVLSQLICTIKNLPSTQNVSVSSDV